MTATGHSRAGWGVGAKRKRYCRPCGTRVSRTAKRCGYCGRRLPSVARILAAASAVIALLPLLAHLLGFL